MSKLFKNNHGGSLSSYAILIGLVTGVSLFIVLNTGEKIEQIFSNVQNSVSFIEEEEEKEPEYNLFVFGANDKGQGTVPEDIVFSDMTGGASHSCAIVVEDNSVQCWGDNSEGQLNVPVGLKAKEIKAWGLHTCAITMTDNVACWGNDSQGQSSPRVDMQASVIDLGTNRSCAVLFDGSFECWGVHPLKGAVSEGTLLDPYLVPPENVMFSDISIGNQHGCGITTVNDLVCWGILKLPSGQDYVASALVPAGFKVNKVSSSFSDTCVIDSSGGVQCIGALSNMPNNTYASSSSLIPEGLTGVDIVGGLEGHCVISASGSLTCWGFNRYGEATPPAENVDHVEAGGYHYLYIKND